MERTMQSKTFDVVVVGSGIAGLTAAATAANQGLRVALVATGPGSIALGAGWLKAEPLSASSDSAELSEAMAFFCELARLAGCPFAGDLDHPRPMPNYLGSWESVAFAPQRLWNAAADEKVSTAIVGIRGLSIFDESFMAERLNEQVRVAGSPYSYTARQIALRRDLGIPATVLQIATCFDRDAAFRAELMAALRTAASGFERILLPGILGLHSSDWLLAQLEADLDCSVCEIPTLPPSILGLRLFHRLQSYLHSSGVELFTGFPAQRLLLRGGTCAGVEIAAPGHPLKLHGESVVLATGRRSAPLLDEPIAACDAQMRPVSSAGDPVAHNLFLAGTLAHSGMERPGDTMRILSGYCAGTFAATTRGAYAS
jgi:glycerol-3-phosphate dehydrogenase subunit B